LSRSERFTELPAYARLDIVHDMFDSISGCSIVLSTGVRTMLLNARLDRVSRGRVRGEFRVRCSYLSQYSARRGNCAFFLVRLVRAAARIGRSIMLAAVALASCGADGISAEMPIASAEISDTERLTYYRAIEICKQLRKAPMALDLDSRVLCFDGPIAY